MKTMTLILVNEQGASEEYRGLESNDDVLAAINEWSDPADLKARLWDSEGTLLHEMQADELAEQLQA